jgi:hypothetical protein
VQGDASYRGALALCCEVARYIVWQRARLRLAKLDVLLSLRMFNMQFSCSKVAKTPFEATAC